MPAEHPVFELTRKLRRALKSGQRLHLDPAEVRVLLDEDIFGAISRLEAEELRKSCQPVASVISSADTGSTSDPTPASGASAGSSPVPVAALSRVERARGLAAAAGMIPH